MLELHFDTIPSTNTYAKESIGDFSLPALITADCQTSGRGRRGNSFFSPKNTGLYMTLVFDAPNDCSLLTPVAAVAVCRALSDLGVQPKIKWVNDVFLNGRKVCGILCERFLHGENAYIALGIGINLTTEKFPDELNSAGSLGIDCDKQKLAREIADYILDYLKAPDNSFILSEYRRQLFVIGKDLIYLKNNEKFSARVIDINEQCNLIVMRSDGTTDILSSGEISIKI